MSDPMFSGYKEKTNQVTINEWPNVFWLQGENKSSYY